MATTTQEVTAVTLFLNHSRKRLIGQHWPRLKTCVESLSEEQIWWRPNEASNSVGNLVLHLNGNVRQWLVASFSRLPDDRVRPAEFNARAGMTGAALLEKLGATVTEADEILARLGEADLLERFEIQGYNVSGLEAVYQVVEHFGLHYGQIAYITKLQKGEDLGFYRDLNKTGRAKA